MNLKVIFFFLLSGLTSVSTVAQNVQSNEPDSVPTELVEKLTYQQQPGLAMAASKIFFSKKRYSISGFGEANFVSYQGAKNTQSGDLELYYTNLYRYATFFGYRISDKIIWNSEFQIEYLHDGTRESHYEIVIEAFADFLIHKKFKTRFGFFPLPIGYVNNNDEPVMFYSVNRSEVERIITPSTWIELGAMFYGNITKNLQYSLALSQGLNAQNYIGGTWIRQGREIRVDVPKSISITPHLVYTGIKNTSLSASAYFGNSGQSNTIQSQGTAVEIKAPVALYTGYAKYDYKNFRFVTVGTFGSLGDTEKLDALSGEVLGSEVYGYLFEMGYDLLPLFRKNSSKKEIKNRFYDSHETKLPIFIRYERLNTHHKLHSQLATRQNFTKNDLEIVTLGLNFNTRENIVIKANYQFRENHYKSATKPRESDVLEFGLGFIF